jgi:hypothetical protein
VQTTLVLLAAVIATGFSLELFIGWRRRPRPHAAAWTVAIAAYALATWSLFLGLATGWSGGTFGLFYLLGAIANIWLLAVGSVYLVFGPGAGRAFLTLALIVIGAGAVLVMTTPLAPGAASGSELPSGREMFTGPGPRIVAAASGGVGTIAVVGLALLSAARSWRPNRRLGAGNVLIAVGTLAPAFGGTLTAFGEAGSFAVSLLLGVVLLWAGYRLATSARSAAAAAPSATELGEKTHTPRG